jgi:hypothetical protein
LEGRLSSSRRHIQRDAREAENLERAVPLSKRIEAWTRGHPPPAATPAHSSPFEGRSTPSAQAAIPRSTDPESSETRGCR